MFIRKLLCCLILDFQINERIFPLLFHVAIDVLPAQASAVPCETRTTSESTSTDNDSSSLILQDGLLS